MRICKETFNIVLIKKVSINPVFDARRLAGQITVAWESPETSKKLYS